jgi:hypothetical protein
MRADAVRETWAKEVPDGVDLRFFLGNVPAGYEPRPDEIILPVCDSYEALPWKLRALFRWALTNDYDFVFKTDDDVYVRPERLIEALPQHADYCGRLRGPSGGFPAPYASGLGYWVSWKAMEILAHAEPGAHKAEDRWVGNVLSENGIACAPDYRYAVVQSKRSGISAWEGPRRGNDLIAACEYDPDSMRRVHQEWMNSPARPAAEGIAEGPLNRICIMIKTFLRDGYMSKCVQSVRKALPDAKMVIVDDGIENRVKVSQYADLRQRGHVCVWLPYDSGFGAKANAAIPHCDREFVLIGSDDFDFSESREGILRMIRVMDARPDISIVSGRVSNIPYEGLLDESEPETLREQYGYRETGEVDGIRYHLCDLTVNYSLIRREVLDKVKWDGGEVKIGGGEHGAFFWDVKRAGFKVAYVEGANIEPFPPNIAQWQHPSYPAMRARARQRGRLCLKKRGIQKYVLFGGGIEKC